STVFLRGFPQFQYLCPTMKILYYSPHPNLNLTDPAGYGTHMREMIAAFRAMGHEVLPVIMGGTEPRGSTEAPKQGLVKRVAKTFIPGKTWQSMKDRRLLKFDREAEGRLSRAVREFQPDMIYERANYMQVSGVRAARRHEVWHVLEMNSPYPEEKVELEGKSGLLHVADEKEAEQLKKSDHIVTVSSSLRDHLIEKHGGYEGKFSVVPNAIDPAKVKVTEDAVKQVREKYGLEGKKVIGWVGSIQPWHGIQNMIRAFAGLQHEAPDAVLMIVGSGEGGIDIPKDVDRAKVEKGMVLTGYIPHEEVFAHIAAMDICLLPNTKWYCSPIKIFEYGIMQKPIIASDEAAVRDVMTHEEDGLLIASNEVKALHGALLSLLRNSEKAQQLADSFYAKVQERHTWHANAAAILSLYDEHNARIPRA
ncbi:MAG: glycosyltransferase family 4 protein, partial [Bacteroidota bacterium]